MCACRAVRWGPRLGEGQWVLQAHVPASRGPHPIQARSELPESQRDMGEGSTQLGDASPEPRAPEWLAAVQGLTQLSPESEAGSRGPGC